jgi:uncharacterized protein (DUF885 family)
VVERTFGVERLPRLARAARRLLAGLADVPAHAVAGVQHGDGLVTDPALAELLVRHWDDRMARWPTWATRLGDRRFDGSLGDASWEAAEAAEARDAATLAEARALDPASLSPEDARTLELFRASLETSVAEQPCRFHAWSISPRFNALVDLYDLPLGHAIRGPEDAATLLQRYESAPAWIEARRDRLVRGAREGLTAPVETLRRTLAQVDEALARPVDDSPLLGVLEADLGDWEGREAWEAGIRAAVAEGIHPALVAWRDALAAEVLPRARPEDEEGLRHLPVIGPGPHQIADVEHAAVV